MASDYSKGKRSWWSNEKASKPLWAALWLPVSVIIYMYLHINILHQLQLRLFPEGAERWGQDQIACLNESRWAYCYLALEGKGIKLKPAWLHHSLPQGCSEGAQRNTGMPAATPGHCCRWSWHSPGAVLPVRESFHHPSSLLFLNPVVLHPRLPEQTSKACFLYSWLASLPRVWPLKLLLLLAFEIKLHKLFYSQRAPFFIFWSSLVVFRKDFWNQYLQTCLDQPSQCHPRLNTLTPSEELAPPTEVGQREETS